MYVISFRRVERKKERKKASGFSRIGGSWITVVNFETDDTRRGIKPALTGHCAASKSNKTSK